MHRYYCRHVDKLVDSQRQIGSYVDIHSSKYIGYPESCRRETGIPIECSSRFAAIFLDARRTFSFASSAIYRTRLPPPHPGRACLCGGLLEGWCDRRKRRSMTNRLNVGMYARLLLPFQSTKMLSCYHLLSDGGEKCGLDKWRNGRRRARLLLHAQREGPARARGRGA